MPDFRGVQTSRNDGWVAQLVEQRIENPRVGGSIPPPATNKINDLRDIICSHSNLNPRVRGAFIRRCPSKPIKPRTYGLLTKPHSITHPSHTFCLLEEAI